MTDSPDISKKAKASLGTAAAQAALSENDALDKTMKGLVSGMKLAVDRAMSFRQRATKEGGLYNSNILEAVPHFRFTEAEGAELADGGLKGKHNTFIIFGRDRPGSADSGGGASPTTHNGCIDIIAGLSGVQAREIDRPGGEKVLTNKSTELDAARIYITQKAAGPAGIDGREYFNIAPGKNIGHIPNRSAIVVKADSVRIVGREGIKFVTGDVYNGSLGLNIKNKIKGIELIAGNNSADQQPLVKGDDLKFVLDSSLHDMKQLHSSVSTLYNLVVYFILSFVDPTGFAASRLNGALRELPQEFVNLWIQEINYIIHELNYNTEKNPWAAYNFKSRSNTTN